jgi:hypothetical protein
MRNRTPEREVFMAYITEIQHTVEGSSERVQLNAHCIDNDDYFSDTPGTEMGLEEVYVNF